MTSPLPATPSSTLFEPWPSQRTRTTMRTLPLFAFALASLIPAAALADEPKAPTTAPATPSDKPAEKPAEAEGAKTTAEPVAAEPKKEAPDLAAGAAGARGAGVAMPGSTGGGGFMDTRLTWTFGDDDFLHPTGQLVPISQNFNIGDRAQYRLFFDGLNSRFAGRENLTHLVMYKKLPGFIKGLTTEASLVLRFDLAALAANTGSLNSALYDSGSFLRIFYNTSAKNEKEGVSAVFFPLDTDRVRLGYLYDISWGGTAASINQSIFPRIQGSSPGLKIQYDSKDFYAFLGLKTATIVQPEKILSGSGGEGGVEVTRVGEANYGVLGGLGFDPTENVRVDVGAGYFQQGKFDLDDVRGQNVYTYGGSARVMYHHNMPVPTSIDFQLYRNDPQAPMQLFRPEKYEPGKTSYSVSAEADVLQQHLKDFDVAGKLKDQTAYAAAIQGVLKSGYLRASATGIVRNLAFVNRNVPGFIPFETLPKDAKTDNELFGAVALDYHLADLHLTPGIGAGLQMPATFRSEFSDGGIQASRVIVVRQQGQESILPYNKDRTPIVQARASVKWDLSEAFAMVGWAQFVRDNNSTLVIRDPKEGSATLRVYQSPNRIGAGVALQARF